MNNAGVEHARKLITEGKYNLDEEWTEARPDAKDENEALDEEGWAAYGRWFLAINDKHANPQTKSHYGFPFGDFELLYRSALIAAESRAGEWDHGDIERAARDLLTELDKAGS
ncbi:hypothetical protein [Epidermidibacterium keratini]|uniref:hypothetical protein n=1 Tax=Epidermidibacterium keratini TaxID=1891644 RepID=UPI001CEF7B52|nr:hypothetical protein [Epidermidibacterium keratini]